jgi:Ser/Thr protein kinase RdoA (MazF antagonist)
LLFQTPDLELRQILERYAAPYHADPAHTPQSARGFSGACIWRIETPAGSCALRAMDVGSVDRQRLAGLHRLVNHVQVSGVSQVPVPVAALDGTTFFETHGHIWQLEPWMPGSADFASHPSQARLSAALKTLALWHRGAERFVAQNTERNWFFSSRAGHSPGLAFRAREIARWNHATCAFVREKLETTSWPAFANLSCQILDGFRTAAPRTAAQLNVGLEALVPLQPCLRDVWHDHVLLTGDKVTGLIDPHAARSDSIATDLARLLGSLVGDDRRLWETGLDAYQEIRPLSVAELALVELFDQTGVLLNGLTWLDWHCLQGRVFDERAKVIGRLQRILARLQVLVSHQ